MPEAEFTIDTLSGEFQLRVHGVAGPGCEDIARLVKELAGAPGREQATAEYRMKSNVRARTEARVQRTVG
jgi:hypothetical protein